MPQIRPLVRRPLLAWLVLVVGACAGPAASPSPSPVASANAQPPSSNGPDPTGGTSPAASAAGGGAAGSSGAASGEVWLPEWADERLPDEVANRRPLPFCGIEKPPGPQPGEFVDRIVRLCFWSAAQAGEEAEWVSIQGTMEGGTIATIYRLARDGTVETLTDFTQDPFGGGGWIRTTCREVVEGEGDSLVGVDGCGEGEPLE